MAVLFGGAGDTVCDRLNSQLTVLLLLLFAFITICKHYTEEAIACWCPAYYTPENVAYANKVSTKLTQTYTLDAIDSHIVSGPGRNSFGCIRGFFSRQRLKNTILYKPAVHDFSSKSVNSLVLCRVYVHLLRCETTIPIPLSE